MPDTQIIEIPDIGPVLFRRNRRARRLRISVHPFDDVRVSVPVRISYKKAEQYVITQKVWIQRQRVRLQRYAETIKVIPAFEDRTEIIEAKRKLTERLHYLAEKFGFTFNRVFIRNQKTRWGSCSFRNNISLNRNLAGLPEHLMDYVILHELAHTRIKNHSPKFWLLMGELVGDGKSIAKELRKYGIGNEQ